MGFKPIRDGHGKVVGVEFKPTAKMLRVVLAMNRAENSGLSNEEILKQCGVSERDWAAWHNDYVIHEQDGRGNITATKNLFLSWFQNVLEIKDGEEIQMLRMVGLEKAYAGDPKFWEPLAKTYGVIAKEAPPPQRKTIPFNLRDDATPEELADIRQKLLESQRAVGDAGSAGLSRLTAKRPNRPGT